MQSASSEIVFNLDELAADKSACVLAIGIFDAVHRGHAKLLAKAKNLAKKMDASLYVLTFFPHPEIFLKGHESASKLIYSLSVRAQLLASLGVDKVFVKSFEDSFASMDADVFALYLKNKFPELKALVTGENFRFGKNASGSAKWLTENSANYGFEFFAVSGEREGGEFVSSTRLRAALRQGDMGQFKLLAGRPYFMQGAISSGRGLGRTLGFPTLNLFWNEPCNPPYGVYAVNFINLDTNKNYKGVANYGVNPSVEMSEPVLETNLFEPVDFGAGTNCRVELLKFFRKEMRFASLEELKAQMQTDKKSAKDFFAGC